MITSYHQMRRNIKSSPLIVASDAKSRCTLVSRSARHCTCAACCFSLLPAALPQMDEWLDDDDNLTKWEDNSLTASDRRILLANWFCKACNKALEGAPGLPVLPLCHCGQAACGRLYFQLSMPLLHMQGFPHV